MLYIRSNAGIGHQPLTIISYWNIDLLINTSLFITTDINAANEDGASPLHLAAQLNKDRVIDALLEK